jgi:predicted GNAT family acetyltransferase
VSAAAEALHHDAQAKRFVLRAASGEAVLVYAELDPKTLDFRHTFTPPALRGHGIASRLTEFALRHARENGLKIVPTCPFVADYIARHPEHQSLLR